MRRGKRGKSWDTEVAGAGERRVKKYFEVTHTVTKINRQEERTSRGKDKMGRKVL